MNQENDTTSQKPGEALKALIELQTSYDLSAWHLNRSIVKLIILSQNESSVPSSAFDKALERLKETRAILSRLETWIVSNASESEQV